jgi:alpha-tubulin suppressor-like RCC1 family protein
MIAEIATSNSTQYALLANGQVYAWGQGTDGQLGNGRGQNSFTTAVRVRFPAGVKIASIPTDTMPFDSGLAIDTRGHAWGWGLDTGGEFCLGNSKAYRTPVELPFSGVTLLAGAADHATYDAHGTLYACGINQHGELGDGGLASSRVAVRVKGLAGSSVTALTASYANSGAVLRDGKYYDWGFDGEGELGDGTNRQAVKAPVRVPLPGAVTQAVEGGSLAINGQTLVKLADGALFAWGDDGSGQLGNDKTGAEPSPVRFYPPAGVTYKLLASGGATSYAISTTGDVYAWGAGGEGQTGDGSKGTAMKPVLVESGATGISSTADDVAVSIR